MADHRTDRVVFGDEGMGQAAATARRGGGIVIIRTLENGHWASAILNTSEARSFATHIIAQAERADANPFEGSEP